MKNGLLEYIRKIVVLGCIMFFFFSCITPRRYVLAQPNPLEPALGYANISQEALAGTWRSIDGEIFSFNRSSGFMSTTLNEGKPGSYKINPIFNSYFIVFYVDKNKEGEALYGMEYFFNNRNLENRHLDTVSATLTEDLKTLFLDKIAYIRVGN